MKKPLFLLFILAFTFSACSKKGNVAPKTPKTVFIVDTDYPVVVIGNQTWMAANYNGPGGVSYDMGANVAANGKLYTQNEANAITLPAGWRLPTFDDINGLLSSVGASEPPKGSNTSTAATGAPVKALMSTSGWINGSGTNSSGFNALPVGFYGMGFNAVSSFQWQGIHAVFITSTSHNGIPLSLDVFQYNPTGQNNLAYLTNLVVLSTDRASVRFIKDN